MRSDSGTFLAPSTVEAIRDLLAPSLSPSPGDADVRLVALGIADEGTRLALARAALASPYESARLARARIQVRESLSGAGPDGEDLADLARLSAFPGPFGWDDARSVFPCRFGSPDRLEALRERGWLVGTDPAYTLPAHVRGAVSQGPGEGSDAGWEERFVRRHADAALGVARLVAEGLWGGGADEALHLRLPNFRAAWSLAARIGAFEQAETLARSLAVPLMDLGAYEDLAELADVGDRAAEALARPGLRSLLLSYRGVAAARQGNSVEARRLWTLRADLNRRIANRVAEADALLDIAGLLQSDGDDAGFRAAAGDVRDAVEAAGRADMEASLLAMLATDRRRAGDLDAAAAHAARALAVLSGVDGLDVGLFVRLRATRELLACGRPWDATDALTAFLARCVEGGRAVAAAHGARELATVLESHGLAGLAIRCLSVAVEIHGRAATRHVEEATQELERLKSLSGGNDRGSEGALGSWAEEIGLVIGAISAIRGSYVGTR